MITLRNGILTAAAFAALAMASTASAQTIEKTVKVAPGGLYEIVFNPADNDLYVAAVGPRVVFRLGQGTPHDAHQFRQVEGLGHIVVGAALRRLDGRHERVLRAHHDDR